jgi:hypothetical protein
VSPAKSAAASKGAAARAEAKPKPKKFTWRGLRLTLPAELPLELMFDIAELEAVDENPMPIFRLLRTMLGPEQFTDVRNKFADIGTKNGDDPLGGLVEGILSKYGVTLGESKASSES